MPKMDLEGAPPAVRARNPRRPDRRLSARGRSSWRHDFLSLVAQQVWLRRGRRGNGGRGASGGGGACRNRGVCRRSAFSGPGAESGVRRSQHPLAARDNFRGHAQARHRSKSSSGRLDFRARPGGGVFDQHPLGYELRRRQPLSKADGERCADTLAGRLAQFQYHLRSDRRGSRRPRTSGSGSLPGVRIIDEHGNERALPTRLHDFEFRYDFNRMNASLIRAGAQTEIVIGEAHRAAGLRGANAPCGESGHGCRQLRAQTAPGPALPARNPNQHPRLSVAPLTVIPAEAGIPV